MSNNKTILTIDQGTTSSRAILFDLAGRTLAEANEPFPQHFPKSGWVEHDPEEIWSSVVSVVRSVLATAAENGHEVAALGITNQRETTVVWDRATGKAIHNAIVWQDRRTASITAELNKTKAKKKVPQISGLVVDPYFSATKIAWILDQVDGARDRAAKGELCFGTVDSFLIWRLTGGRAHITDATNACRTALLDVKSGTWSDDLLDIFRVPREILPTVVDSAGRFGTTDPHVIGTALPITGIAGDQQSALIGQAGFERGDVKCTYGTGAFIVANTGRKVVRSKNKLLSTIGYQLGGERTYALEGSILMAGATMQWLRDSLQVISDVAETADIASSVEDNGGVYLVPAFTGLGAPHWAPDARGVICGLSRGSTHAHIVRAGLESSAHQTADLLEAMAEDGFRAARLKIDGGMARNDWFAQFLADMAQIDVVRPANVETTAIGAARLAGIGAGLLPPTGGSFASGDETVFSPSIDSATHKQERKGWRRALKRALLD